MRELFTKKVMLLKFKNLFKLLNVQVKKKKILKVILKLDDTRIYFLLITYWSYFIRGPYVKFTDARF